MIVNRRSEKNHHFIISLFLAMRNLFYFSIKWLLRLKFDPISRLKFSPLIRNNGRPVLLQNENSELLCDSCGVCQEICPPKAIEVLGDQGERPNTFNLNLKHCTLCFLCEIHCPSDAIKLGSEGNINKFSGDNWIINKEELMLDNGKPVYVGRTKSPFLKN